MRTRARGPRRGRRGLRDGRHHRRAARAGQAGLAEPRPPRARHAALGRRAHLDGAALDGAPRAAAATRSASPAASRASSPTIATSTRASSRCGRSASRTSSRAARSSSSPATRACPTGARSRRSGAAAATRPRSRWPRRSAPSAARSTPTSTASTPPTRASCPRRTRIGTLSYEEMQELAEAGAKVLNAQAVEFAKEKGIAIYARATRSRRCRARIPRRTAPSCGACAADAGNSRRRRERAGRRSSCRRRGRRRGSARRARRARRRRQTVARRSAPGERDARDLAREPARRGAALRRRWRTRSAQRALAIDGLGAVSVVGAGINASYANVRRGRPPARAGIALAGIATSSFRITWLLRAIAAETPSRAAPDISRGGLRPPFLSSVGGSLARILSVSVAVDIRSALAFYPPCREPSAAAVHRRQELRVVLRLAHLGQQQLHHLPAARAD